MLTKRTLYSGIAVVGLVLLLAAWPATRPDAQQAPQVAVQIDNDDIGGGGTSKHGPGAGGWGVAGKTDPGTRFAEMGGTDDQGRYAIPDLPPAPYSPWGRGDGLGDSPKGKS